jgi:hypothetical protein
LQPNQARSAISHRKPDFRYSEGRNTGLKIPYFVNNDLLGFTMSDVSDRCYNACPDLQPCKSFSLVKVFPQVPEASSSSEGDFHVQTQLGAMRLKIGNKLTSMRTFTGLLALIMMMLMTARHIKAHFSHSSFEGSSNDKNLASERISLALEFSIKQNDLEQYSSCCT